MLIFWLIYVYNEFVKKCIVSKSSAGTLTSYISVPIEKSFAIGANPLDYSQIVCKDICIKNINGYQNEFFSSGYSLGQSIVQDYLQHELIENASRTREMH
jgi:hypothetical protein